MNCILAAPVYLFAGLSVLHWAHVNQSMRRTDLWCGNVVSDPLMFLINFLGPLGAMGLIALFVKRFRAGQRSGLPWWLLVLFLGTAAGIAYEVLWLRDYGLELGRIWWLPRLW